MMAETPDARPTLQEAMEEAYASAPSDLIMLAAMEVWHPAFIAPLRVVNWPVVGNELVEFRCRHEAGAPRDPGGEVSYHGFPFEIVPPESSHSTEGYFKIKVSLYNDFDKELMEAAMNPGVIRAIFRQYVKGRELEGPVAAWPDITISSPRRQGADIVADGSILGWMAKPFGGLYLPSDYPGLAQGR